MSRIARTLLVLFFLLLSTERASAQDGTPPATMTVTVSGRIVNQTTGEPAPEGLALMLHSWDQSGMSLGMIHGTSLAGGTFLFPDVVIAEGILYGVMVAYDEVNYFSPPLEITDDGEVDEVEIAIYETSSDPSPISLDLAYFVLGQGQGGLAVLEMYAFSNHGERTVIGIEQLDDGTPVTLAFTLPDKAANVSFPASPSERFVVFPGGFADTLPLKPGPSAAQIAVTYVLPYTDSLSLVRTLPFSAQEVNVLIPLALELEVQVQGGEYLGTETLSRGQVYEVYSLGSLQVDQPIRLDITGEFVDAAAEAPSPIENPPPALPLAAMAIGLALIALGAWSLRRLSSQESPEAESESAALEIRGDIEPQEVSETMDANQDSGG